MSKRKKSSDDLASRFISAGGAMARLGIDWVNQNPTKQVFLKSVSIKPDGTDFVIIMRGLYGIDDVVLFFRIDSLEKLASTILSNWSSDKWRPDKYGGIKKPAQRA